jgi:hypothetical protein
VMMKLDLGDQLCSPPCFWRVQLAHPIRNVPSKASVKPIYLSSTILAPLTRSSMSVLLMISACCRARDAMEVFERVLAEGCGVKG